MEDFRSKSYNNEGPVQMENAYNNYHSTNFNDNGAGPNYKTSPSPTGMKDLRCCSASYASSSVQNNGPMDIVVAGGGGEQWKFKKGKSTNGVASKSWSFNDPELQRKKRVASYKAYTVEGKLKGSIKKSFRWIKERYTQMVYGYR